MSLFAFFKNKKKGKKICILLCENETTCSKKVNLRVHFHCAIKTLIKWVQSPCNLIIAPFKIKCVALNSYFSWSRCTIKDIKINLRVLIHWLIDFIVIDGGRNDAVKHHRDSNMDILRKKKKPEYQKHFLSTDLKW